MGLFPDEGKVLPPPGIVSFDSVWLGLLGWGSAILDNLFKHRPGLRAGVHRQVLLATAGWFSGYHLRKYSNYCAAVKEREVLGYLKAHPEKFPEKKKQTFAEIVQPFNPIR